MSFYSSTSAKNFCTALCTSHNSTPPTAARPRPSPPSHRHPVLPASDPPLNTLPVIPVLGSSSSLPPSPPPTRQPISAPRGPSFSFAPHPRRSRAAWRSRGLLFPMVAGSDDATGLRCGARRVPRRCPARCCAARAGPAGGHESLATAAGMTTTRCPADA